MHVYLIARIAYGMELRGDARCVGADTIKRMTRTSCIRNHLQRVLFSLYEFYTPEQHNFYQFSDHLPLFKGEIIRANDTGVYKWKET
ncbi:hypothetical protein NECAME_10564 [Necator americanus]|uniref:Uncharacterized protein n=1 Tax=Necator americanus TaxID=51031 RepID=W2T7W8_NECAM|nr:hypothetical protein NECAME_10564 [Necator americanus]ETN78115.1 hypothetical protein NECAME_10564 [Necator americanus]